MQQPREPVFYPNDMASSIELTAGDKDTLQSIDDTLKRIEKILNNISAKKTNSAFSWQQDGNKAQP